MIAVVITTINPPSVAVERLGARDGNRLVVVGDRKTPLNWSHNGVDYLSLTAQHELYGGLSSLLPENHYCRKNIGYVHAIKAHNSNVIFDTDDDNIPYDFWCSPNHKGEFRVAKAEAGFLNVYTAFSDAFVWPRGFPLNLIRDNRSSLASATVETRDVEVPIWQGLADLDPDVDAIYRLAIGEEVTFERNEPLVLDSGTACPFNSQATFFHRWAFPLLYLPTTVSFRATDIIRGYVAQVVLWNFGLHLGFTPPSVYQERNPHNLVKDLEDELQCYRIGQAFVDGLSECTRGSGAADSALFGAYQWMAREGLVQAEELGILRAWLKEFE